MSQTEAKLALQRLLEPFELRRPVRRGLLGDSNGTVMVANRPGWAYIRYHDDLNRLTIVRYLLPEQLPDDTPVVVGRKYPDDPYEQVLGADWTMYAWAPSESTVNQYATPAIDLSDLSPGMVVPTDPISLSVDVRAFLYINDDTAVEYGGGTIDLTAHVPGVAGHRQVLVYIDLATDTLDAENGTIVAVGTDAEAPDVPDNSLPLGLVDLANGEADIDGDDIYQYKALYETVGTPLVIVHDTVANLELLEPTTDTLAYGSDTASLWFTDASYNLYLIPDLSHAVVHDGDVVTHDGEIQWVI